MTPPRVEEGQRFDQVTVESRRCQLPGEDAPGRFAYRLAPVRLYRRRFHGRARWQGGRWRRGRQRKPGRCRDEHAGNDQAFIERVHDFLAGRCFDEHAADDRGQDRDAAQDQRVERGLLRRAWHHQRAEQGPDRPGRPDRRRNRDRQVLHREIAAEPRRGHDRRLEQQLQVLCDRERRHRQRQRLWFADLQRWRGPQRRRHDRRCGGGAREACRVPGRLPRRRRHGGDPRRRAARARPTSRTGWATRTPPLASWPRGCRTRRHAAGGLGAAAVPS